MSLELLSWAPFNLCISWISYSDILLSLILGIDTCILSMHSRALMISACLLLCTMLPFPSPFVFSFTLRSSSPYKPREHSIKIRSHLSCVTHFVTVSTAIRGMRSELVSPGVDYINTTPHCFIWKKEGEEEEEKNATLHVLPCALHVLVSNLILCGGLGRQRCTHAYRYAEGLVSEFAI